MGNLLSSAIKMQNGGVATATLTYELFDNGVTSGGSFKIYKNGSLYQTMTTTTSLVTITINAGDTFYATIQNINIIQPGSSIDYFVNGTFTTNYFTGNDTLLTTSTTTAVAGTTYKYTGNFGAV